MVNNLNQDKILSKKIDNKDDIDFKLIFNFLNRNKKLLSLISILFLLLGYVGSKFTRRTWGGQFQIVISTKTQGKVTSLNPTIASIAGLSKVNNLKTEVGILKSPFVLMPVFESLIFKNDNLSNKDNQFSSWKKKLDISLQRDTTILNIFYKDKEKSNILPVLKKISTSYQDYSGKRKKEKDANSKVFLEDQIKLYRKKSADSLRIAQEYAIDKDLIYFGPFKTKTNFSDIIPQKLTNENNFTFGGLANNNSSGSSDFLPININIEKRRVEAANEIRKIDMQLKKIEDADDKTFEYIGSTIPELIKAEFLASLRQIDSELVEASSKYNKSDNTVKRLIDKKELTIRQLKQRSINFLKSKKLEAEASKEAATRPKNVLLKYKELIRDAGMNENIYIQLEDRLRTLELTKSKKEIPWELITKPTLLNKPVDKTPLKFSLIGLLGGFAIGIILCLKKEKNQELFLS